MRGRSFWPAPVAQRRILEVGAVRHGFFSSDSNSTGSSYNRRQIRRARPAVICMPRVARVGDLRRRLDPSEARTALRAQPYAFPGRASRAGTSVAKHGTFTRLVGTATGLRRARPSLRMKTRWYRRIAACGPLFPPTFRWARSNAQATGDPLATKTTKLRVASEDLATCPNRREARNSAGELVATTGGGLASEPASGHPDVHGFDWSTSAVL